jgi:hypothetical protein
MTGSRVQKQTTPAPQQTNWRLISAIEASRVSRLSGDNQQLKNACQNGSIYACNVLNEINEWPYGNNNKPLVSTLPVLSTPPVFNLDTCLGDATGGRVIRNQDALSTVQEETKSCYKQANDAITAGHTVIASGIDLKG